MYIKHYWMSCLYRVICDFLSFCVFQISCSELGSRHSIWSEKSLLSLSDQNQDKHKIFELCFSGFFAEVFIFSKSEEELASVSPARKVGEQILYMICRVEDPVLDPGLCTSIEVYCMNILDSFQSLPLVFILLVSDVLCKP